MMQFVFSMILALLALPAFAIDLDTPFGSIDGGTLSLRDWAGQPVLVVNTASRCGFTKQYAGLQALYDTYRSQGLVVLAVPSNDFRQELSTEADVKDFCEVQFGLDIPMTVITSVKGAGAHPFYAALNKEHGFSPSWNFNKVLIGPDGDLIATYGSRVRPTSRQLTKTIESLLP